MIICYTVIMNIIYFEELESTNKYAKSLAQQGSDEFTVVIANRQTEGYGRMGRHFYSPEECGLYMSIILRPRIRPEECLYITTAAAVAVSQAIEAIAHVKTGIKWVNDIHIDGRKVCGILTEAGFTSGGMLDYAVLGIGVNIYSPHEGYPAEIKDIAGSIFDSPQNENIRDRLTGLIIDGFKVFYDDLRSKPHLCPYRKRSIVTGKEIRVIKGDISYTATALDIDDDFRLIVRDNKNNISAIESGEISIRM